MVSRTPTVLVYHGIASNHAEGMNAQSLEQHILFLKRHFVLLHPNELERPRARGSRPGVVLSFDDGFRNNAELAAPILRKHGAPALFFICSRHSEPGKYLWFVYFNKLLRRFKWNRFTLRGGVEDMSAGQRHATVRRLSDWLAQLKPHPAALYKVIEEELPRLEDFVSPEELRNECEGMRAEEIEDLAADPLFAFGVHTMDHPFLSRCEREEAIRQIGGNKNWLESMSARKCDAIAYPCGDYTRETLECCRAAGLTRGYAEVPKFGSERDWEVPRIGIYSPSLDILGFKAAWGRALAVERWPRLQKLFPRNTAKQLI